MVLDGLQHAARTCCAGDNILLQIKLENFRRNRQVCPARHRPGFDRLIRLTEAEIRAAAADAGDRPDRRAGAR